MSAVWEYLVRRLPSGSPGAADLSIVIRTLVLSADRISFGLGGAVLALSEAVEEYEETLVRAAPMVAALRATVAHELVP